MTNDFLLGIEIGGTKLQVGVAAGAGGNFLALERRDVLSEQGAAGILTQIEQVAGQLLAKHEIKRIGIGFGGPVNSLTGRTIKSHQVSGWDDFPLVEWCDKQLGRPAVLGNDCDCAALAEARLGAGRGRRSVFYVTVGTGIGGGLVLDGKLCGEGRPTVAEIGHLRPGLAATDSHDTVESRAAGPGLAAAARHLCASASDTAAREELLRLCQGDLSALTGKQVGDLALVGNSIARTALSQALQTLGWAIAQVLTIASTEVVVVGGGVSLLGEAHFFEPLRAAVAQYVFPPLANSYRIVPAALGEEVVVHGAIALASQRGGFT